MTAGFRFLRFRKGLGLRLAALSSITLLGAYYYSNRKPKYSFEDKKRFYREDLPLPNRSLLIKKLEEEKEFDLLVIGGGATGAGVALDASSRGLKVALVEKDDYGAGTSSRSTKLVHGGVRYLEKAFKELDFEQFKLVIEALHERATFLKIAPHLSHQLPIMLPIYQTFLVPYYWVGSKVYDLLAGKENLESSYFINKRKAQELFPILKPEKLAGAMVYFDGQHNDTRMNVALILTAIAHGATCVNHMEVTELTKDENGRLSGATLKEEFSGQLIRIKAKGIINATGPFTDSIRKMDEPQTSDIVAPSAGIHIILPKYFCSAEMGLLDPSSSDGRVIFFLPWEGSTIVGTTDSPAKVTSNPAPTEEDIQWLLNEVTGYISPEVKVRRKDVIAAWSGIRPLVRDPGAKNTEALVRNHMIHVSDSGLLTIAGGKWTTYRSMAKETVDKAIGVFDLRPEILNCYTDQIPLVGAHEYSKALFVKLIQKYGLEAEVAKHLAGSYGDRSFNVASLSETTGEGGTLCAKRITPLYPYIVAEIRYACQQEYACTVVDVLARRTRLAFLDANTTFESLPQVIEVMASELHWTKERCENEYHSAVEFLSTMGLRQKKSTLENLNKGDL